MSVTATDYETWKTANGVTGGLNTTTTTPTASPTTRNTPSVSIPPAAPRSTRSPVQLNKSTGTFSYTRRDPVSKATGLTYTVWTSTNLVNWTPETDTTAVQTPGTPNVDGINRPRHPDARSHCLEILHPGPRRLIQMWNVEC